MFAHKKTSDVPPDAIAHCLAEEANGLPELRGLGIPDFSYTHSAMNSRPDIKALAPFKKVVGKLDTVSGGMFYSQKKMEAAWSQGYEDIFKAAYRRTHGRKPRADHLAGVRFCQARALRVMHNHWHKPRGFSEEVAGEESHSDCDDETIAAHLQRSFDAFEADAED